MPRQGSGPVTSSSALGASDLQGGLPLRNRAASGKRKEEEHMVCHTAPTACLHFDVDTGTICLCSVRPRCSTTRSSTVLRCVLGRRGRQERPSGFRRLDKPLAGQRTPFGKGTLSQKPISPNLTSTSEHRLQPKISTLLPMMPHLCIRELEPC